MGKRISKKAKVTTRTKSIAIGLISLIVGIIGGAITDHYIIPLYFTPHSDLHIVKYVDKFTIENSGDAPIDWLKIEVKGYDEILSMNHSSTISPLDIAKLELFDDNKTAVIMVNNILPRDWVVIRLEFDTSRSMPYKLLIWSGSRYVLGDTISITDYHDPNSVWGPEESFEEWVNRHPDYVP